MDQDSTHPYEAGLGKNAANFVPLSPIAFLLRSAAVYPQDVAARLGVAEQMASFLPLRVGTLIRFIREAFVARLAADRDGDTPAEHIASALEEVSVDLAELEPA